MHSVWTLGLLNVFIMECCSLWFALLSARISDSFDCCAVCSLIDAHWLMRCVWFQGNPPVAKVLSDYTALKEDEISVCKGQTVQILAQNQHNMYLVHREANDRSPAAEGWIPTHLLSQAKEPSDNGFRKSWHLKLKKPSLKKNKDKKSSNSLEKASKRGSSSSLEVPVSRSDLCGM